MKSIPNSKIVSFLARTTANGTFVQNLKIKYRPYVCPFDELLGYVNENKKVFDIGCGSGQFCALVAKFTDAQDVFGIEINQELVSNAKEINKRSSKDKKVNFAVFDGGKIPSRIRQYDLIYMIDVYHHMPVRARDDFIKQLYTKMKPGAKLVFKDIDGSSPFVICNKAHDMIFARELSREISHEKAKALMISSGFNILESWELRTFVYPHYFILAQK